MNGELEVSAVSIHAFAHLADQYALLASGSSMGDRYGPKLIAREPLTLDDLRAGRTTIAIPGTLTTAYLTLQLCLGKDVPTTVHAVRPDPPGRRWKARSEVGLIIHEGQLYYPDKGLAPNRRPRPVVVRGDRASACRWAVTSSGRISAPSLSPRSPDLLKQSIVYALEHRQEALDYALTYARDLDPALADRFVGMYVNDWTVDYGPSGRRSRPHAFGTGVGSGFSPSLRLR